MSGASGATWQGDRRLSGLALAVAAVLLMIVMAACGISGNEGSDAGPTSTATTVTTVAPAETTTTRGADFTLPSIPRGDPNTTQSTRPPTTIAPAEPTTRPGGGSGHSPTDTTPGGVNEDNLTVKLVGALDLPQDIAACTSRRMFDTMTADQLDTFVQHIDTLSVPSDIQLTFTGLLSSCVAGD